MELFDLTGKTVLITGGAGHPVKGAGHVEQAFSQGRLAAAAVSQQTDVADVLYRIAHGRSTLLSLLDMVCRYEPALLAFAA